jgi:hypothetical protein
MSFDLRPILERKQALRRRLAARPVAEKLRLLDALRERTVLLRRAGRLAARDVSTVREPRAPCGHPANAETTENPTDKE